MPLCSSTRVAWTLFSTVALCIVVHHDAATSGRTPAAQAFIAGGARVRGRTSHHRRDSRESVASGDAIASFYDVVMPPGGVGLQLDPDTLRVIRTGSLKDLPLPGTVANIAVGDRLVAINKHSLAFKPYSAVRRLLQTLERSNRPRTLRFATERNLHTATPLDVEVVVNQAEALGVNLTAHDLVIQSFVKPDGKPVDTLSVTAAFETAPREHGVTPAARNVRFGQSLATGRVRPGDRVIAVGSTSLLGLSTDDALLALKQTFVPSKTEEVRCRGPTYAVYCSVEQLPRKVHPTTVTLRPAPVPTYQLRLEDARLRPVSNVPQRQVPSVIASRIDDPRLFDSPDVGTMTLVNHKGDATAIPFRGALFGGQFPCKPLRLFAADPPSACRDLHSLDGGLAGAAILVRRGDCFFETKARFVQHAGGAVAIVYNVHSRDPATRMPCGDGTADDVTVPAAMITADGGAAALDAVRQARQAYHVATGDEGAVWVTFSAPGMVCDEPLGSFQASDATQASADGDAAVEAELDATGEAKAATAVGNHRGKVELDSSVGASAFLEALLSQRDNGDDAGDSGAGYGALPP